MNLLDIALAAALVGAAVGGVRVGLLARIASWVGLAVGVVLSTWTVPFAVRLVDGATPQTRLLVGIGALAVTISIASALFSGLGARARARVAETALSGVDRAAGAVAAVAVVVGMVWFLLPAASAVPGTIAQQVRSSRIVATIDAVTPDAPDPLRVLRGLIGSSRFPEVFADLGPSPEIGPPPESIAVDPAIVEAATAATAHVRSNGCGAGFEGSSFAISADTLMTNAHVVAGAGTVRVRFPDGETREAEVVVFDPVRDLALLHVPGHGRTPIPLGFDGTDAVVIGYPGGQLQPRVAPASIEGSRLAVGRDIYGRERSERNVLFLAASLRQGDSGSPVVDAQGRLAGVVFAISPDRPNLAYALDNREVEAVLAAGWDPGNSGPCM
jgi:S1-C subfamily serine protease